MTASNINLGYFRPILLSAISIPILRFDIMVSLDDYLDLTSAHV